jgi:hypothetical protein
MMVDWGADEVARFTTVVCEGLEDGNVAIVVPLSIGIVSSSSPRFFYLGLVYK